MDLGTRLRQERLAKGLSQRQLCGDVITRNMLSQIENGSAKPSMDTLVYLAAQLEKPVSYFLEGQRVCSGAEGIICRAREAFGAGNWEQLGEILDRYPEPEEENAEYWLLKGLWLLHRAENAIRQERRQYARELLMEAENAEKRTVYGAAALSRRRMLLFANIEPEAPLPPEDDGLLLRARRALEKGNFCRSEVLLNACEEKCSLWWRLYGEVALGQGQYEKAAQAFHRVETPELYGKLEECYRQMENYQRAYEYACKQRTT